MSELVIKLIIIIPVIGVIIWAIVLAIKSDIEKSDEISKYTEQLFNSFTTIKNGMAYEIKEKVEKLSLEDYVDVLRTKIWTEICNLEYYQHYESNELCILLHPNDFEKFQAVPEESFKLNKFDTNYEYFLYGVMIKPSNKIKEGEYKVVPCTKVKSVMTLTTNMPRKETEKETCDGCGAPITGRVCEYCGRVHWR